MPLPTNRVMVSLRMPAHERDALVANAKAAGYTFNGWVCGLIQQAAEAARMRDAMGTLEAAAHMFAPLVKEAHAIRVSNDYRRTVGKLTLVLQPLIESGKPIVGREREALVDLLAELATRERVLEIEASDRLRDLKTTGAE